MRVNPTTDPAVRRLTAIVLLSIQSLIALAPAYAATPDEPAAEAAGQAGAESAGQAGAEAAGSAAGSELDLPPQEKIDAHKSFDPGPELQQISGGGLIVNAFIMDGPVRVEIVDADSGEVILEKRESSLFPFEVSRHELGVEPTQVAVRIYVKDELAHELRVLPEH